MPCSRFVAVLVLAACGPSIAGEDEAEAADTEAASQEPEAPVYGAGVETDVGLRVPVCIPADDGCIRLSVVINSLERLDEEVTGELVGFDCRPTDTAIAVETFHGFASTGHGTLFVRGDVEFVDGLALALDVQAEPGDCT